VARRTLVVWHGRALYAPKSDALTEKVTPAVRDESNQGNYVAISVENKP
jgi:hypothetical protein